LALHLPRNMSFSSNLTHNISSNFSVLTTIAAVTTVSNVLKTDEILGVIDRYVEISLYTLGFCGALLNIFTFLQKQLRSNPCSTYFLAASFCDLCICNIFILTRIMILFNQQGYVQFTHTLFWCKFGNYCIFMFPCLSSLCIALASMDRFCSSSRQAGLRKLSSVKVSRIVIPCVFLIWGLFSLHTAIGYDLREFTPNSTAITCTPAKDVYTFFVIVDGFFFALFNGAIVPFFLALFGILIILNVRQTRRRAAPRPPTEPCSSLATVTGIPVILISRLNRHLISMLLVQVCLTVFLNLPYVVIYLNNLFHTVTVTSFYLVVAYIATWFYYLNYCKTFYINTLTSQLFRSILKQQVLHLLRKTRTKLVTALSTSGPHQT
jgi:hypothetical protein